MKYTDNLKLFKYEPEKDGKQPFSIEKALNENWDKIDASLRSLEICDIGMVLYVDESKGKRRYLNGQIVDINTNTQAFLNRLLQIQTTNPDYFTDEATWQSEAALNIDGCVYKFVLNYSGADVVSVRLPKYPDYVEINVGGTLPVIGNGKTLGLTDGSINYGVTCIQGLGLTGDSNFYGSSVGSTGVSANLDYKTYGVTTDPDKSGIETTLKQTKLKMRYFIQIATGQETEANIVNTLENVNGFTLLESKYSDKPLYNESWLLSNGQWNAKAVYPTAYEGLQVEYNTEIEAGTTVTLPSGVSYTKRGLSVKLSTEEYTDYDFVLNTAEETFKLPLKTKQKFYDDTAPVVGNGISLGLTDGSHNYGIYSDTGANRLIAYSGSYGQTVRTSGGSAVSAPSSSAVLGVTTNGSKSGLETHLTETTLYLYYYVGDLDQNRGIVNMGRIGEQLVNKVDVSNTQWATNACMPDYSAGVGISSGHTATVDGYVVFTLACYLQGSWARGFINGIQVAERYSSAGTYGTVTQISVPIICAKGDVITFTTGGSNVAASAKFYPLKGAKK